MKNLKQFLEKNKDDVEFLDYLTKQVQATDYTLDYLLVYENNDENLYEVFGDGLVDLATAVACGNYNRHDQLFKFGQGGYIETLNKKDYNQNLLIEQDNIISVFLNYVKEDLIDIKIIEEDSKYRF